MDRSNQVVWKFPLGLQDSQAVQMPVGADVLTAQVQGETLCLWTLCDREEAVYETRTFAIHGTGHPVYAAPLKYIGTVQLGGGTLVLHVFEIDTR